MALGEMSLWGHLNELRRRLRTVALSLIIVFILILLAPADLSQLSSYSRSLFDGTFLSHTLLSVFLARIVTDILPKGWVLIAANGIGEALEIYSIAGFILAIAINIPLIAYEAYKFAKPALRENERRLLYPFIISTSILFVVGLFFGYFVLARVLIYSLAPFFQATQIAFSVDAASFYYVTFFVILATGITFTTPVIVYSLIKLRITEPSFFSENRAVIWFGVWIVAALILTPPGTGPVLDVAVFVPMVTLLELAVFLARKSQPRTGDRNNPAKMNTCRYCSSSLAFNETFCRECGKAQI